MSILNSIGNTPLVEIKNIWKSDKVRIFAKIEGMNPGGSIKDRVAYNMIKQAISRGDLKIGMEVIEATSGNTGIGLAMVCAALKYPCTLVMPKAVSKERRKLIKVFGARQILLDGTTDNSILYVERTMNAHKYFDTPTFYNPNQFDNPDNWKTHWLYTGPEICKQLRYYINIPYVPNPDIFIASCGTTGTIVGCKTWFDYQSNKYRFFGDMRNKTKTVAVFPPRNSKIQGLKNLRFSKKPKIYNKKLINERVIAHDEESFRMTQKLAREEGIFCGMSSGAAMCEAIRQAKKAEGIYNQYTNIVVILPDNGYRYISEGVF